MKELGTLNWSILVGYVLLNLLLGWILSTARATAGQFNISVGNSRRLPIPLPPTVEQCVIMQQLDEIFSRIDTAEEAIDQCFRRATRLRQSILMQAFVGQIVPQDRTDEAADRL